LTAIAAKGDKIVLTVAHADIPAASEILQQEIAYLIKYKGYHWVDAFTLVK
jgi:hypothetical protein